MAGSQRRWEGAGSDDRADQDDQPGRFKGTGKPEPLKGEFFGWWSRRITDEHRMVYRVAVKGDGQRLEIAQLRCYY